MKDEEVIMTASDICPNGVPKGLDDRCYRCKVMSYDGSKETFNLKYLDQCVRSDGHEWISLLEDYEDESEGIIKNMPRQRVLDAHVRNINVEAKICEYRKAKADVLRASLELEKKKPIRASEVDVMDLVTAANMEREKGWMSQSVLEVSSDVDSQLIMRHYYSLTNEWPLLASRSGQTSTMYQQILIGRYVIPHR